MARLVGVDLPRDKRVEVALTYIYGIGRTRAQRDPRRHRRQPRHARQGPHRRASWSSSATGSRRNYKIEGDLRREVAADIRRKVEIGCYQGLRHRRGLPVRGQRTHTNARTRKGPRHDRRRQEEGRQEVVR